MTPALIFGIIKTTKIRYKLILANKITLNTIYEAVFNEASEQPSIRLMELFGSFAKGDYYSDNDIDILLDLYAKVEEGISMAAATLLNISKDDNERARLLTEYKIILDYQSGLAAAKQSGITEAKTAFKKAIKLIALKTPIEKIVEETGLEQTEVEELLDDFNK